MKLFPSGPYLLASLLWLSACGPGAPSQEKPKAPVAPPPAFDTMAVAPPPPEPPPPDYDTSEWTEVIRLDSTIRLDLRYATTNNFVADQLYDCPRCFLRPDVARALLAVQTELRERGLGLKLYDCYRPAPVQWQLWEKVPDRRYVADPRKGSQHSRGNAVDLTVVDAAGRELPMGTPYDYFGPEAHTTYAGLPAEILANRRLLSDGMRRHGFRGIRTEWWHFSLPGRSYELAEMQWNCPPPVTN